MCNEKIKFYDEDGEEVEAIAKYEVCWNCGGNGKTVNPAIDGHGLTAHDFAEDPDFAEAYFSGIYDVPCGECGGKRVVPVIDEDQNPGSVVNAYWNYVNEMAAWHSEMEAERRMGA